MFAVITENVAPDQSGTKFVVDYFVSLNPAKEFAVNSADEHPTVAIFEEIGFVHNGEVIMRSKFERNNKPISESNNDKDSN